MDVKEFSTICVARRRNVGFITFDREASGNTITPAMVRECNSALDGFGEEVTVVVLRGGAATFCNGADFHGIAAASDSPDETSPEPLYELWTRLAFGDVVSVACVEGRANAGGIGFVGACDIVLAAETAEFGLSEMIFGLLPACVMPFLVRRVGWQRARYLTLMTRTFPAARALEWGLVDAMDQDIEGLLGRHLARLARLPRSGIRRFKRYMGCLERSIGDMRAEAIAFNREAFGDPASLSAIRGFVRDGKLPWES
jgi:polyketide biosynthesis enoyl-CoA hydratase PksH